jgi:alpha-beta hydrolase superfamily lysophospholipase
VDDVRAFLDVVRPVWPSAPLVLLGHSMGGLIAASYVERDQAAAEADRGPSLCGLVLSSPFLGLKMKVSPAKLWSARILSRLAPRHPMSNGLRAEDLSHDQTVVAAARRDPLSHKAATPRWATEVFDAQRAALAHAGDLRLPLLLMYAGDDQIADASVTQSLAAQMAGAGATVIRYEGYYHEIFNEVGREQVFAGLGEWLDELTAAAGASESPGREVEVSALRD